MISHFPVLMVAVPLMAAPMCLLIRQREIVRIFATAIALSLMFMSIGMIDHLMGAAYGH